MIIISSSQNLLSISTLCRSSLLSLKNSNFNSSSRFSRRILILRIWSLQWTIWIQRLRISICCWRRLRMKRKWIQLRDNNTPRKLCLRTYLSHNPSLSQNPSSQTTKICFSLTITKSHNLFSSTLSSSNHQQITTSRNLYLSLNPNLINIQPLTTTSLIKLLSSSLRYQHKRTTKCTLKT